ncbi:MAG: hypothetical protein WCP96_22375, partial [Methylococcaceae bacterium]
DKLIRLPAPVGAAMMEALKPVMAMENTLSWYGKYDEWVADPVSRGRFQIVGGISPSVLASLQKLEKAIPKSAEIAIEDKMVMGVKQARHEDKQNGLPATEWRQLPALLEAPNNVFYDVTSGKIIYILQGENSAVKGAVELDYRVKKSYLNAVVSGYRQSVQQIEERIKRGDWVRLQ